MLIGGVCEQSIHSRKPSQGACAVSLHPHPIEEIRRCTLAHGVLFQHGIDEREETLPIPHLRSRVALVMRDERPASSVSMFIRQVIALHEAVSKPVSPIAIAATVEERSDLERAEIVETSRNGHERARNVADHSKRRRVAHGLSIVDRGELFSCFLLGVNPLQQHDVFTKEACEVRKVGLRMESRAEMLTEFQEAANELLVPVVKLKKRLQLIEILNEHGVEELIGELIPIEREIEPWLNTPLSKIPVTPLEVVADVHLLALKVRKRVHMEQGGE